MIVEHCCKLPPSPNGRRTNRAPVSVVNSGQVISSLMPELLSRTSVLTTLELRIEKLVSLLLRVCSSLPESLEVS
jgi:hypothetical protein